MDISSIAIQGLDQASAQLDAAAANIATAGAGPPDGATLDTVDLCTQIVPLISAQTLFAANLATLKTTDQMQKSLIDITA